MVEPRYYDIADDVLNRSKHRYAHLFNTKLLMKKKIRVEKDSAVLKLEIKNPIAQQYFDYQLGRIHAVELSAVKEYENAISAEGRVSIAMDSYFLRFDRIHSYYLGQKTFELNRIRAEKEIARLNEDKKVGLAEKGELEDRKSRMTVSYTHLDVYKRQLFPLPRGKPVRRQYQGSLRRHQVYAGVGRLSGLSSGVGDRMRVICFGDSKMCIRDRRYSMNLY